ncbi:MAG: hypothetical protein P9M15_04460, partial [Candidatus Electryoneaceae bacterium]|nr:hypothetical protein [Candidatus Electryoneaceae bacterium]
MKGSIKRLRRDQISAPQIGMRLIILAVALLSSIPAIGEVRLVATDDHSLTVEYQPEIIVPTGSSGAPDDPVRPDDPIRTVRFSLKNADIRSIPGMLEIPICFITVAIPPTSKPSVRLMAYESGQIWNGSLPVNPADPADRDRISRFDRTQTLNDPAQSDDPVQPIRDEILPLIENGTSIGKLSTRTLSGLQVIRIPIYPIRIRHHPEQVELAKLITIRIDFNVSPQIDRGSTELVTRIVANRTIQQPSHLTQSVVLNADQAIGWRRITTSNFTEPSWPQGFLYRFTIEQEGIYGLTYDDLIGKGVDLPRDGVPSDRLKLFGNGGYELPLEPDEEAPLGLSQCALYVDDGNDGIFGIGDRLIFYGRGAGGWMHNSDDSFHYEINHYTLNNVYWLNIDPSEGGLRMGSFHRDIDADTSSTNGLIRHYYEPDEFIYNRDGFVGSGRQWYGYTFDGPSRISFNVSVDNPDTTLSARLKVRMVRSTNTRTWIDVDFNYTNVGGFSPQTPSSNGVESFSISPYIKDGINTISFEQTHESAKSLFDWLEISCFGSLNSVGEQTSPLRVFEAIDYTGAIRYDLTGLDDPWTFDVTNHSDVRIEQRGSFTVIQERSSKHRYITTNADRLMSVSSDFDEYFPPESDIADL